MIKLMYRWNYRNNFDFIEVIYRYYENGKIVGHDHAIFRSIDLRHCYTVINCSCPGDFVEPRQ
jgi:hypothetical protein